MASPKIEITPALKRKLKAYMLGLGDSNLPALRAAGVIHAQRRTLTAAGNALWESMKPKPEPAVYDSWNPGLIGHKVDMAAAAEDVRAGRVTPVDWDVFNEPVAVEPTEPLQSEIRSNTQLAKHPLVQTTPTMASRLRSGKRQPSIDMANRVLTALHVSDAEFRIGMHAFAKGGDEQAHFFDRHMGRWGKTGTVAA